MGCPEGGLWSPRSTRLEFGVTGVTILGVLRVCRALILLFFPFLISFSPFSSHFSPQVGLFTEIGPMSCFISRHVRPQSVTGRVWGPQNSSLGTRKCHWGGGTQNIPPNPFGGPQISPWRPQICPKIPLGDPKLAPNLPPNPKSAPKSPLRTPNLPPDFPLGPQISSQIPRWDPRSALKPFWTPSHPKNTFGTPKSPFIPQSIPSEMEFDPNSNPPCYKTVDEASPGGFFGRFWEFLGGFLGLLYFLTVFRRFFLEFF